jgi:hypothetical protein
MFSNTVLSIQMNADQSTIIVSSHHPAPLDDQKEIHRESVTATPARAIKTNIPFSTCNTASCVTGESFDGNMTGWRE